MYGSGWLALLMLPRTKKLDRSRASDDRPVVRVRARPQCIFSQSPHLRAACIFSLGRPTFATYLCAQTLHIFAYTTPVHGASSTLCTTPLEAGCRTGRTRSCPAPASAPHPQRIGSGWYRVFCTLRRHRVELLEAVTTARRALVVI